MNEIAEQIQYLNQRIRALASEMQNIKSSSKVGKIEIATPNEPVASTVTHTHTVLFTDEDKPAKSRRGRPKGPAKLYSLRAAYNIFLERGLIQKRNRGRPRKAS